MPQGGGGGGGRWLPYEKISDAQPMRVWLKFYFSPKRYHLKLKLGSITNHLSVKELWLVDQRMVQIKPKNTNESIS